MGLFRAIFGQRFKLRNIKGRIERLEGKVLPKPKRKPLRIRFIYGDKKLSTEELAKSMKLCFDDDDMIMRMPRPGQADAEDAGADVLTVRVVDPKAQDQADQLSRGGLTKSPKLKND